MLTATTNSPSRHHHHHMVVSSRGRGGASRGSSAHPVNHDSAFYRPPRTLLSSPLTQRHSISAIAATASSGSSSGPLKHDALTMLGGHAHSHSSSLSLSPASSTSSEGHHHHHHHHVIKKLPPELASRRLRAGSFHQEPTATSLYSSTYEEDRKLSPEEMLSRRKKRVMSVATASLYLSKARTAMKENDAMVYLEGPQVYSCVHCRTHLTSHDDIVSKSFHGRHGRAFLFDKAVNVTIGKAEDRALMTGLHSVCDIFCKRCKTMVGWTYARCYEASQKYKENKFIIEKINLYLEEQGTVPYDLPVPAGERQDRWKRRSKRWGDDRSERDDPYKVYEYRPPKIEYRATAATTDNKGM